MGRVIILDTGYQTVSAVQDLLEITADTDQAFVLHSVRVMQSSDEAGTEAELLQLNLKRASGSFTSGSGGGSATAVNNSSADAAHSLGAAERNNTTQASAGSGELSTIMPGVFNVLAGEWEYTPTPELRPPFGPSQSAILSLDEAPADAITLRAVMVIELVVG